MKISVQKQPQPRKIDEVTGNLNGFHFKLASVDTVDGEAFYDELPLVDLDSCFKATIPQGPYAIGFPVFDREYYLGIYIDGKNVSKPEDLSGISPLLENVEDTSNPFEHRLVRLNPDEDTTWLTTFISAGSPELFAHADGKLQMIDIFVFKDKDEEVVLNEPPQRSTVAGNPTDKTYKSVKIDKNNMNYVGHVSIFYEVKA